MNNKCSIKDSFSPEYLVNIQQKIEIGLKRYASNPNFKPHSTFEAQLIHKNGDKV